MKFKAVVAGALLASAFFGPAASANSLASSSPTSGAVLVVAPNAVSVVATSPLQADGNQLSVTDPKGNAVDDGSVSVTDASVVVGLKPLTAAGVYTVTYTLLAAGEAPLQGSYTFLYNAPADMSASPTPTPVVTTKSKSSSGTGHGAIFFVMFIFALGCGMLLFLIWYARTLWHQGQRKKRKASRKKATPSTRTK